MKRSEALWLAFEKFAIFFSFAVTFILVMVLLAAGIAIWRSLPLLQALRTDVACPLITDVNGLVTDLNNATITRTIHISQTIPVQFSLYLDKNLNVRLTQGVQINRPTSFRFPAGGGQINGTVSLVLPRGQTLPIHMQMNVPVDQQLPVAMNVPVSIPLKETELGPVTGKLKDLLLPYMDLLDGVLHCSAP
jgi:hypothetical protein